MLQGQVNWNQAADQSPGEERKWQMKMLQLDSGFWGLGMRKDDEIIKKKRNMVQVM